MRVPSLLISLVLKHHQLCLGLAQHLFFSAYAIAEIKQMQQTSNCTQGVLSFLGISNVLAKVQQEGLKFDICEHSISAFGTLQFSVLFSTVETTVLTKNTFHG